MKNQILNTFILFFILTFAGCIEPNKVVLSDKCSDGEVLQEGRCIQIKSTRDSSSLSCGDLLDGESVTRERFQSLTVPFGESCISQTQTSSCSDGVMSAYIGSYTNSSCQVEDNVNYSCTGNILANSKLCQNDDIGLTQNIARSLVGTCTSVLRCEYECISGYELQGNLCVSSSNTGSILAFPGAEGFGARSIGGRGGQVIKVTNLLDSGPGSFREAVTMPRRNYESGTYKYESEEVYNQRYEASGNRIVVFEVSGIINLESGLTINVPYLTIAGQTSPGGILITGHQTTLNAHDVIIRHMRFRVGSHRILDGADPETLDSFDILGKYWSTNEAYNIIIDHCSFGWGVDETMTVSGGVLNTTIQHSIVAEGLSHAGHPKGEHSKGLLISGKYVNPTSITLYKNYIAQNGDRNPQIYAPSGVEMVADVVNNVSYNWKGGLSPYSGGSAKVNWRHNYMKQGANSNSYSFEVAYTDIITTPEELIYVNGNIGSTRFSQSDPQWNVGYSWRNEVLNMSYQRLTPWTTPNVSSTTEMSHSFALEVVNDAGASVPIVDSVDQRVKNDFKNETGKIIDDVKFPEDFPTFANVTAPIDSDNDGMPDEWELSHGLNIFQNDSAIDSNGNGYTNIEDYINELAQL